MRTAPAYGRPYSAINSGGPNRVTPTTPGVSHEAVSAGHDFHFTVSATRVHGSPRYKRSYSGVYMAGTDTASGPSHSGRSSPDTLSGPHVSAAHRT